MFKDLCALLLRTLFRFLYYGVGGGLVALIISVPTLLMIGLASSSAAFAAIAMGLTLGVSPILAPFLLIGLAGAGLGILVALGTTIFYECIHDGYIENGRSLAMVPPPSLPPVEDDDQVEEAPLIASSPVASGTFAASYSESQLLINHGLIRNANYGATDQNQEGLIDNEVRRLRG